MKLIFFGNRQTNHTFFLWQLVKYTWFHDPASFHACAGCKRKVCVWELKSQKAVTEYLHKVETKWKNGGKIILRVIPSLCLDEHMQIEDLTTSGTLMFYFYIVGRLMLMNISVVVCWSSWQVRTSWRWSTGIIFMRRVDYSGFTSFLQQN